MTPRCLRTCGLTPRGHDPSFLLSIRLQESKGFVIPSPSPSAKDERLQIITYIHLLSCGSLDELSSVDVYLSYKPTNLDRRRKRTAPFSVEGKPSTPILPSPFFSLGARLASRGPPTSGGWVIPHLRWPDSRPGSMSALLRPTTYLVPRF
jgi:hypothetical protein